ncbi:MAG: NAD-dependent epimerase/dehydratase family protein [Rhodanobacter sp.]|nr:MAG: NAD-dependent epimerase/dehydratase family protein [Rhodanobacter sp.]TAM39004.1 MAG: NAD-dependent epimerase/dehydratase family protein [Rhodanobacter sp.]
MKVVIFGGGGFIGSAITDRLLKDGHSVRIFERPRVTPYRTFSSTEHVEWLTGDLLSTHDVTEAIDGVDVVVHLVSTTLPKSSNDDPIYDVQSNLVATLQMLTLMVQKKIPKIVFISSGGTVYGTPEYLPIDERHPTEPRVSYGITKLAIEKYLLMYQRMHGLKAVILRVANPYGERQRIETAQGAVGVFLHRALKHEAIDIWGDGSVTRDYIYIGDVANAFALAVQYDGMQSVFNISSGHGTSLNELLGVLERALGYCVVRNYVPGRTFDVPTSILACELAKTELGWSPSVGLEDGVEITVDWLKRQ